MNRILITGGTVFVSRYMAEYFRDRGYEVWVLNRNTRPQSEGVHLIESDRHCIGNRLKGQHFDAVIDVTAYGPEDITDLLEALDSFDRYVMISSSAVYPETAGQPFSEGTETGPNTYWGRYGTDKIAAEQVLLNAIPDAYILRPPYLYGPGNNVYREAFVFDCAMRARPFFLPGNGEMKLQFFHVRDLCRITEKIIEEQPCNHILNVGNPETVTTREWVRLCYECAGMKPEYRYADAGNEQRQYFSFYDYEYRLDVSGQTEILPDVIPLKDGLKECYAWYTGHRDEVRVKPLIEYIDRYLNVSDGK